MVINTKTFALFNDSQMLHHNHHNERHNTQLPTMNASKLNFAVVGNPIHHSKSPLLHHLFAKQVGLDINYQKQLCQNDDDFVQFVTQFFVNGGIGLNITVPFKQTAFLLCKQTGQLSDAAKAAGAVNTLYTKNGVLCGDNTDGLGLVQDLGAQLARGRIAIIGAGGATCGVLLPLAMHGAQSITIFNRTTQKALALCDAMRPILAQKADGTKIFGKGLDALLHAGEFDILINATSATLQQTLPANLDGVRTKLAYDMVYGRPSPFLAHFATQNIATKDGLGMLIHQGAQSFYIWTKRRVDVDALDTSALLN